jgi:tryptophanase
MANTFNNAQVQLTSTALTDVYTAPTGTGNVSIVLSTIAANYTGSAPASITIVKADNSNTLQSYIAYTIPIPQNTSLECIPNKVVLKAGEKIRAQASVANYFYVTVSALEITTP